MEDNRMEIEREEEARQRTRSIKEIYAALDQQQLASSRAKRARKMPEYLKDYQM